MLTIIKDTATGWIAGIIIGALIISFSFFGVSFYFDERRDVNVATVNGAEIELQTFQRSFYNLRQQMQSIMGDALSSEEDALIKEQAIQKLIDTELINQIVQDSRLGVTDAKIVETIKNIKLFKSEEDIFDRTRYERAINSLGMEPTFFERQLRMDLLSEQLQVSLSESLFVTDSERQELIRLKSQTRDITYSIFELGSFIEEDEIENSEIEVFYQVHPERYVDPEKVKIAYLELDVDALEKSIAMDDDVLKAYYSNYKDKYDVVEQRSVSQLFVKTAIETADKEIKEASDEVRAKAESVMESTLRMIKDGMAFEEIIEKFTEEGKAALQFSEHAFVAKGVIAKEIDEFLFQADEGEISEIVKTKEGLSIIKVGEIRGGPKNNYENVADKVEQDYRRSQAELYFFELADQLATLSYEHSDSLEFAADAIGQAIMETDYFSRKSNAQDITGNSKIKLNSFDPELINSSQNSDIIELSDMHLIVLRVLDYQVAATKPLDEVRDQIIADIRAEKGSERIKEHVFAIVEQLKSGAATDTLESDLEIEWSIVEKVNRDAPNVNRSVLRKAFQAGNPVTGNPVVSSHRLGSGDYAVTIVTAVYPGEVEIEDKKLQQSFEFELYRNRASSEWQTFLENARENADVKVYRDNI